jgi:hypothetical protein
MSGSCQCGHPVTHAFHRLACIECGLACCPACAVHLESVTYCQGCAGLLLGTTAVRAGGPFELR